MGKKLVVKFDKVKVKVPPPPRETPTSSRSTGTPAQGQGQPKLRVSGQPELPPRFKVNRKNFGYDPTPTFGYDPTASASRSTKGVYFKRI